MILPLTLTVDLHGVLMNALLLVQGMGHKAVGVINLTIHKIHKVCNGKGKLE